MLKRVLRDNVPRGQGYPLRSLEEQNFKKMIWVIFIAVMLASYIVQAKLTKKFEEFSQVPLQGGLTGAEVARRMLRQNAVSDVTVESVGGTLTDHYNPLRKTVNLSEGVYGQANVAAAAVAAHECGHVLQHSQGYLPLTIRTALVPVVNFSNKIVQWVLLLGIILINITPALLWVGIALFAMSTLFSLVTLPVEINASRRAVQWLDGAGIVNYETKPMAEEALKWAAYTYVIAALGSLATLLYYIAAARSNSR